MNASSANEQVVVRFIADNASYLKGIADCQNSLNKYAVYTSNILEKIEKNISKMNSTAITGAQKVAIAVEKTAQVQINAAARQMEAEAKLITSKAKLITAEQKRFSQAHSNYQMESRNTMSMFQHYTNLGAQLGFLVRQYMGLFAVFSAIKKTLSEGMGFNKFTEETTMAFSVMMKSADEAKYRMQELYNFAVKSPLTFKETAEAARQLMAYGFQANELVGSMKMLGTVGKAVGASMQDMAYTYGTLRAQNHAYSRDLMQFSMRGIPIYEELAKVLDVNVSKIQKLTEEGKVGFKEVEKAFQNMTASGGRFGGMLEAYMQTFAGKVSMLTDIAQKAAGDITEQMFAIFKTTIDNFIDMMGTKEFQKTVKSIGTTIGMIAKALMDSLQFIIAFGKEITFVVQALVAFKIALGIMSLITKMPVMLMTLAKSISTVAVAQQLATIETYSFSAALQALKLAAMSNPFTLIAVALSTILVAIPAVIKKLSELKAESDKLAKEQMAKDKGFRTDYLAEMVKKSFPSISQGASFAGLMKIGGQLVKEYGVSWMDVSDALEKYNKDFKISAENLKNFKNVAEAYEKPLNLYIPTAPKNAEESPIMTLLRDMTDVNIDTYTKTLFDKTEKLITGYEVNTSGIIQKYIGNIAKGIKDDKRITEAFGGVFTDEDMKKSLEKELKTLTELYVKMAELGDYAGMKDIVERAKQINAWLIQNKKDADALKEFTKALEKYNEEITKMQDQVDMNKVLGFDPTELEKLTYEFNKTIADMGAGKGIFAYITDPAKRAEYKRLLEEIYNFNVDKLNYVESERLKKAMASYQLEYDKLVLGEDQLAVFDAELKFKLDSLDATKAEYGMVAKIGELQRKNLEKEIQLTKAKKYLQGESAESEAFWNRVTVNLATSLGMKKYENGTNYVPETGPAILHKGEAVIPADEAERRRSLQLPTMTTQDIMDMIFKASSNFGFRAKSEYAAKRATAINNGTWRVSEMSFPKEIENLISSIPYATKNGASFYSMAGVDPTTGKRNPYWGLTAGSNIAIQSALQGQEATDVTNHEYGHYLEEKLLGKYFSEALMVTDYSGILHTMQYFCDRIDDVGIDINTMRKRGVSETDSGLKTLLEEYTMLLPKYNESYAAYKHHPIEQLANWLGGKWGELKSAGTSWEEYFGWSIPNMPTYAKGTQGAEKGVALVGEKGPELVYMNGGETVIPNNMLKGYADGAFNENIGKVLALGGESATGSEMGKMVAGGDPVTMALTSLAKFAMSIENVQKVLNPFATIIEGLQPIIEPLINSALQPLVEWLIEIGKIIGTILTPILNMISVPLRLLGAYLKIALIPLQLVGKAFQWLNDKVIVPVGNVFIDIMNGIIKVVNMLPFVNIAYLDHLQTMEEIATQEEKLKKGNQSLTDTLTYLNDKLKEEVDKQIGSYKDLYELGLMTASEYEKNVKLANAQLPTQDELVSINDKQLTNLVDINDRIAELVALQKKIDEGKLSDQAVVAALTKAGLLGATSTPKITAPETSTATIPSTLTKEMLDARFGSYITNAGPDENRGRWVDSVRRRYKGMSLGEADSWLKSVGYATGTGYVPQDMLAMVHRGEIISPKTFSDSIRSGELSLGGRNGSGGDTYVSVTVNGSVTSENDLVVSIAKAIKKQTVRGYV